MEDQTQYLTVKEFAKIAKVSNQAIYKQLDNRLKPYVKKIKGKKMIGKEALKEFYGEDQPETTNNQLNSTQNQPETTDNQPQINLDEQPETTQNQPAIDDKIKALEQQISELLNQSREETEFLKDQIRKKDEQIEQLTNNLTMAQQLAAADKKKILELEQKEQAKQEEKIVDAPEPEPEKKKGFFSRFFK